MGKPVHGLIVGGAHPQKRAYLEEIIAKVKAAGLEDDITLTGQRSDLKEIMTVSDLVLSLSTKPESFGRTTLEALSLDIPVAGYNHGGVGELLKELYPQGCVALGDRDGLIRVVTDLLEQVNFPIPINPYTLQRMSQDTEKLYLRLAEFIGGGES